MTDFLLRVVFSIFLLALKPISTFQLSGLGGSRTQRHAVCTSDLEYPHNNICCLNCPAGEHVKVHCTSTGEKSQCNECDYGTYTEHANGLPQCFKCTQCRSDQELVRQCTTTQDTQCQCKPGWFCDPDQACEVCKRCSKCKKDEVIARNCTSTTNTDCKKIQTNTGSVSANPAVIVPVVLITALLTITAIFCFLWRKRWSARDSRRNVSEGKAGQSYTDNCPTGEMGRSGCTSWPLVRSKPSANTKDECKVLCESLNSSASNSQHSLTDLPSSAFPALLPPAMQPTRREDEQFPQLIPVNGEVSLKKCLEYFEDIDIDYHKRFFRHLGITDNVIKSKEHLPYEDKIHELLNIWVEKEGRDASLNNLLQALLDLNQRRTAETVMENAITNGHYVVESRALTCPQETCVKT